MRRHLALERAPLDAAALTPLVEDAETGAVVSFVGRVREREAEELIEALDYEVYEDMARRQMERLADEIEGAYPDVRALALCHRMGIVPVGEAAVVVAVGAGHRQEAFAACRHGIDRLKEIVPIWKSIANGARRATRKEKL